MSEYFLLRLTNESSGANIELLKKETRYFSGGDPAYGSTDEEISYDLPTNTSLIVFAGPDPDKRYSQYGGFCFTLFPGQTISNKSVNVYGNGSPSLYFYLITVTNSTIDISYNCTHTGYGSFSIPVFISFYGVG